MLIYLAAKSSSLLARQNASMKVLQVQLRNRRSVEVGIVGADQSRSVFYFHSPATAGEEMRDAASAAANLDIQLISIRRPSVACDDPGEFVEAVAVDTEVVIEELGLDRPAVLGWSGGAPYALATAVRGPRIASVHLVSPVPGPLTGPDALPDQSERLRQVAHSTASSDWISGPSALRDYQAVAAPWRFDVRSIERDVTIWSPTDDDIVPPRLLKALAQRLSNAVVVEVPGAHGWLIENWSTVLDRM